jgi:hypothetical protein
LFLKVRVSVFTPLLSVVVVISELSGAVVVVVLVAVSLAFEFALVFAFDSLDELQPAAANPKAVITIPIQIFLLTSPLLQKVPITAILTGKRYASYSGPVSLSAG